MTRHDKSFDVGWYRSLDRVFVLAGLHLDDGAMSPRAGIWLLLVVVCVTGLAYLYFGVVLFAPEYGPLSLLLGFIVVFLLAALMGMAG